MDNFRTSHFERDNTNQRIIVVGRTGSGKSSVGNTLLDKNAFHSILSSKGVTQHCTSAAGERSGSTITVVDTPGISHTNFRRDEIVENMSKAMSLASPGPHVILLVIAIGRFTKEDQDAVELFKDIFEEDMMRSTIIVFTKLDELEREGMSFNEYIQDTPPVLEEILSSCRHIALDATRRDEDTTKKLHKTIEEVMLENEGKIFTKQMFQSVSKKSEAKVNKENEERRHLDEHSQEERKILLNILNLLTQKYLEVYAINENLQRQKEQELEKLKETVLRSLIGKRTRSKTMLIDQCLTESNISHLLALNEAKSVQELGRNSRAKTKKRRTNSCRSSVLDYSI